MKNIEVAKHSSCALVASTPDQAKPACQTQHRQGFGDGFMGRYLAAGNRGQVAAQLVVGWKSADPIIIEQKQKNLPGIALQRGQARIKQERPGHRLVAITTEEKAIPAGLLTLRLQAL